MVLTGLFCTPQLDAQEQYSACRTFPDRPLQTYLDIRTRSLASPFSRAHVSDTPENKARFPRCVALRDKIKEIGFVQLQKSVWVCPYECEDEILFLAESYYVTKYIEILTVEKMLHEEQLKRKFKL